MQVEARSLPKNDVSSIIPQPYFDVLVAVRDTITDSSFLVGDVAGIVVGESAKNGLPYTDQEIFDAIGRIIGRSGRTVRYYYETACFFNEDDRRKFSPLPFSHFVVARRMKDDARLVLEYSLLHPLMSAAALEMAFIAVSGEEYYQDENEKKEQNDLVEKMSERQIPDVRRPYTRHFVENLSEILENLSVLMSDDRLSEKIKKRIASGIELIRSAIPDLVREIEETSANNRS